MQFWNRLSSPCILHRYKRLHFHSTNKSSKSKDSNQIMGIFSSNFLQNLKLFWQFVGNFDKQCFLIISHKRISFFVVYFHWTFPDSYWIFRFIYWNSHFYGSNFYGWSIGDLKSLTESGPFHSQGEQSCSLEITVFQFSIGCLRKLISWQKIYRSTFEGGHSLGRQNFILISFASRHYFLAERGG